MIQVDLSGTYTEIGRQYGQLVSKGGNFIIPAPKPDVLPFVRRCEKILEEYAPELLEEMHSLSEAACVDYDSLVTITITASLQQTGFPSCTAFVVTPERVLDGRLIFGRNYDFVYDIPCVTYRTYPKSRYPSIGSCDIWVGREDGLNAAGLFVAMAALMLPGYQPGLTFWFVVKMVLDQCATVEEGIELIRRVPHAQSRNFLLADCSGKALAVEVTIDGIHVREPENGLLVIANHAVSSALAGKEVFVPADSRPRYERIRRLLGDTNPVDMSRVKAALRDHEGGVCAHWVDSKGGTLWSVAGHPDERNFQLAGGHPCDMSYNPISF